MTSYPVAGCEVRLLQRVRVAVVDRPAGVAGLAHPQLLVHARVLHQRVAGVPPAFVQGDHRARAFLSPPGQRANPARPQNGAGPLPPRAVQFSVASFPSDATCLSSGAARSQAFRLSQVGFEMFERLVYRDLHRPDIVGGVGK